MTSLAEVIKQYGSAYRQKYGQRMLPSHHRTMTAILQCRTQRMGGHLYYCDACQQVCYSYHSCQNRHCPQCQAGRGYQWLEQQKQRLLPVPHFLVTFTLPQELRSLARSHQKLFYNLLFRTSAAALQQLARDPRFVGGQIGMVGVLQTWTRDMTYHPHVHYLVPGGGLAEDGESWQPAKNGFLVHVKPLSRLFRGKFRAALKKTDLYEQVPPQVWQQQWVVHCQRPGCGVQALNYLAPYIFRTAISNSRILKVDQGQVTFRYKTAEGKSRTCALQAEEFLRRFLQHSLPKGFVRVRYYGLLSPAYRTRLEQLKQQLAQASSPVETEAEADLEEPPLTSSLPCPQCGQPMRRLAKLAPVYCRPP